MSWHFNTRCFTLASDLALRVAKKLAHLQVAKVLIASQRTRFSTRFNYKLVEDYLLYTSEGEKVSVAVVADKLLGCAGCFATRIKSLSLSRPHALP